MGGLISGNSNEFFVKSALTFSLMTMLLMTSFITVFVTNPSGGEDISYDREMESLLGSYYDMTGRNPKNEQIWGLTGIYTPVGTAADGKDSTSYMRLNDGWVAGGRIGSYTPTQYDGESSLNNGAEGYTVSYDNEKRLYYYTAHGSDLLDIRDGTASDPSGGTLYTAVTMDIAQKSTRFFTSGSKTDAGQGDFYYEYTGYRYCFQSLSDYYYDQSTPITHTDTSLSLIWYQYTVDSGISGQLVLSGSDAGVSYITAGQIVRAFDSANYSAKFTMAFNGIEMFIYVYINPYALNHGYTVEDCYNNGFWSVMVTSPSVSSDSGATSGTFDSFDVNKVFDVIIGLLSFRGEDYGLTGIAGTIASTVFSVSMYTSLIAIGLSFWPVLLVAGILAVIQSFSITNWWPF